MTSSEYNDNRPQDGQDERERRRSEREGYDVETIERYRELVERFAQYHLIYPIDAGLIRTLNAALYREHDSLLDKEGY